MTRSVNVAMAVLRVGAGLACSRNDNNRRAANDYNRTATATPSPTASPTADTGKVDETPSAGDITAHPDRYAGQQVTLKSSVDKVMPNGFFTLKDKDLLVLSPSGEPMENQDVTVHGTVQTYSAPDFKKRYSWFHSTSNLDRQYKDRPVVVADSILTADGREVVTERGGANNLPASSGEVKNHHRRP
jgi:hypothetical protein